MIIITSIAETDLFDLIMSHETAFNGKGEFEFTPLMRQLTSIYTSLETVLYSLSEDGNRRLK